MALLAREKGDLENNLQHMLELNLKLSFPVATLPCAPSKRVFLDVAFCLFLTCLEDAFSSSLTLLLITISLIPLASLIRHLHVLTSNYIHCYYMPLFFLGIYWLLFIFHILFPFYLLCWMIKILLSSFSCYGKHVFVTSPWRAHKKEVSSIVLIHLKSAASFKSSGRPLRKALMVTEVTSLMLTQPWHTIKKARNSVDCHKHFSATFLVLMTPAWFPPCHSLHNKGPVAHTLFGWGAPLESGHLRTPTCLMSQDSRMEEFIHRIHHPSVQINPSAFEESVVSFS